MRKKKSDEMGQSQETTLSGRKEASRKHGRSRLRVRLMHTRNPEPAEGVYKARLFLAHLAELSKWKEFV